MFMWHAIVTDAYITFRQLCNMMVNRTFNVRSIFATEGRTTAKQHMISTQESQLVKQKSNNTCLRYTRWHVNFIYTYNQHADVVKYWHAHRKDLLTIGSALQ